MSVKTSKSAPKVDAKKATTSTSTGTTMEAVPLLSMLDRYDTRALSPESENFLKELREHVENKTLDLKLELKRLEHPNHAYAVLCPDAKAAVIFMFQEGMKLDNPQYLLQHVENNEAVKDFTTKFTKFSIVNIIVIEKDNYNKVGMYADFIIKTLRGRLDEALNKLNINYFKNKTIILDVNPVNIKNFISRFNIGVEPRNDFGFIAYVSNQTLNPNMPMQNVNLEMFKDIKPFLAVTGYNEFIYQPNMAYTPQNMGIAGANIKKFTPIVHVSDIISLLPHENMIPFAILLAAEVFIGKGLWRNPEYNKTTSNLIVDPSTKKPWKPKNIQELQTFMDTYLLPPLFCVDVIEGKPKLPGLNNLISNTNLHTMFSNFFQMEINTAQNIVVNRFNEIAGYVIFNNVKADSRVIDYCNIVEKIGYKPEFERFLTRFDPITRAKMVEEIVQFEKLYVNYCNILNPVIQSAATEVARNVNIIVTFDNQMPVLDFSSMMNYAFTGQSNLFGGATYNPTINYTLY